jgi:hypothetical protein
VPREAEHVLVLRGGRVHQHPDVEFSARWCGSSHSNGEVKLKPGAASPSRPPATATMKNVARQPTMRRSVSPRPRMFIT